MNGVLKCVIWDLDNTLWDGVLPEGDDVAVFPEARELVDRLECGGIVQSVASKNDHDDAWQQLTTNGLHEMFVYPQISWSAKSRSVQRIIELLNIGADSVIFLDDSEFERGEVAAGVPGVRCYSLQDFLKLDADHCLVPSDVTPDAARRPSAYREDSHRKAAEETFTGTSSEFLASLNMVLTVRDADADDLGRAAELTERTNQLNTTGETYSAEELADYVNDPEHRVVLAELSDRFGDYGRIGLCLLRRHDDHWSIELLLMSCRVMGRNVGTALIAVVAGLAHADKVPIRARYRPNGRNRQMRIAYSFLGFKEVVTSDGVEIFEHTQPGRLAVPAYTTVSLSPNWIGDPHQ
ncbi:FkbH-like protein [Streptomyces sp. SAI-117]|uniref:HAD-IIIC family phosphatase n=1 Tax=Streptomyces sp. SAI-117 TaxID=2940546 RepID=UPI002475F9AE|nr:HAD-IIIC family phosphatase [Streptomyces sp. SAI-117]MDH6574124.1 FkbH-like protein [Streptomyces sp. SAI-117]